ncbi:MAG: hypothetical protein EZS28_013176, partial [Streblomastix strix]
FVQNEIDANEEEKFASYQKKDHKKTKFEFMK